MIMANYKISLALLAMTAMARTRTDAFTPTLLFGASRQASRITLLREAQTDQTSQAIDEKATVSDTESKATAMQQDSETSKPVEPKKTAPKKKPPAAKHGKDGVFTPVVKTAKNVMGEEELNKLRGKVIGLHSNVITDFVGTADSPFGQTVLKQMYAAFDTDRNGTLEESELEKVLKTLGFSYLNTKQVNGIFERADADADGHIDEEEWKADFPKTLRTNLIKLAKKNGGDMGLLS
jgi:hypothetical protein